jgi:hypothetical protein
MRRLPFTRSSLIRQTVLPPDEDVSSPLTAAPNAIRRSPKAVNRPNDASPWAMSPSAKNIWANTKQSEALGIESAQVALHKEKPAKGARRHGKKKKKKKKKG